MRWRAVLRAASDTSLSTSHALQALGALIDLSDDLQRPYGIRAALAAGDRLLQRELVAAERALLHYFLANAFEVQRRLSRSGWELAAWEQPELERQIVHLRSALALGEGGALPAERLTQVLTNLGNLMSHCGRLIEALAYWDRALVLDPTHAMARGNRGYGLEQLATLAGDPGHQRLLLRAARDDLGQAIEGPLEPEAYSALAAILDRIETRAAPGFFQQSFESSWPTGMAPEERTYREWCLDEHLFLNDVNEIGSVPVAAADVLVLPDMTTTLDVGLAPFGLFNQMKQEYVSARFLLYAGLQSTEAHFADRDVTLVNTLDYPAYGFAAEQVKMAFRMAYSLLDKVAYFLNEYLGLRIPETQVSFKKIWYERNKPHGLRPDIQHLENMPLLGLFWLSKDLFEDDQGFRDAIEPDARELETIRQNLEHKYLKLHMLDWCGVRNASDPLRTRRTDNLGHSLYRADFESRTLRLMRMARAAIMYLSSAVYVEESKRAARGSPGIKMPVHLDTYGDDWKF